MSITPEQHARNVVEKLTDALKSAEIVLADLVAEGVIEKRRGQGMSQAAAQRCQVEGCEQEADSGDGWRCHNHRDYPGATARSWCPSCDGKMAGRCPSNCSCACHRPAVNVDESSTDA
jgi:hypothetical protein